MRQGLLTDPLSGRLVAAACFDGFHVPADGITNGRTCSGWSHGHISQKCRCLCHERVAPKRVKKTKDKSSLLTGVDSITVK